MLKSTSYSFRLGRETVNCLLEGTPTFEEVLGGFDEAPTSLSKEMLLESLVANLEEQGWEPNYFTFLGIVSPEHRIKFMKDRVGLIVEFGLSSNFGLDILKFQHMSYAARDRIDAGIYVVPTRRLLDDMGPAWDGTLTFEKVREYLPYFRGSIQVPIHVVGLET